MSSSTLHSRDAVVTPGAGSLHSRFALIIAGRRREVAIIGSRQVGMPEGAPLLTAAFAAAWLAIRAPRGGSLRNELPTIVLQKLAQRTAFIEVANSEYLTQSMGSSGAQAWLAGVTYTLTEHPNIKAVDFSFTPGEHAMPGVYTRDSFRDYKIDAGK